MKYARQLLLLVLIFLVFVPLLWIAKGGTDFDRYMYWGLVFKYADIFQLRSSTLTPSHIPHSQWSFGPGLIFSLGLFFNRLQGALYVGWIFNTVFWVTYAGVLRHVTGDRKGLVLLGLLLTFIATPIGYYSSNYSSESLSYACLAAASYWLLTSRNGRPRATDHLIVGICLSLLIAIRPQLLVYCLPLLGLIYHDLYQAYRTESLKGIEMAAYLSASHVPLVLSVIATGIINYWMTGSPLSSPYLYSHGSFRSMEWLDPEFLAILLNPFHGLLVYHPFYLVAFISLIALAFRFEDRTVKLGLALLALSILAHLYIHAAWFWWWLADSFGMRGVSIAAIFLIPAFLHLLVRLKNSGAFYYLLLQAAALSACWSFTLLLQPEAICLDFDGIGYVVNKSLDFVGKNPLISFVVLCISLFSTLFVSFSNRVERIIVVLLTSLFCFYLAFNISTIRQYSMPAIYLVMFGVVTGVTVLLHADVAYLKKGFRFFLVILYGACLALFIRTGITTFELIRNKSIVTTSFKYISAIDPDLITVCYNQYLDIPGFEEKKRRLREFRDHVNRSFGNPEYGGGR